MRKLMGIWVCHTKAVVVRMDNERATTTTFVAEVSPKTRATGGTGSSRPYMHCSVNSRDRLDHARDASVTKFFVSIAKAVADADEVVVVGPGEAKKLLANRLAENGTKVAAVESAGSRLTDAQIAARIMKMFGRAAPRMPRNVPGLAVPTV